MVSAVASRRCQSKSVHLAAVGGLVPLQQGQLDGLCGLYAVINALRLILAAERPLSQTDAERLFQRGVEIVDQHGELSTAAIWGVRRSIWKRVVVAVSAAAGEIACVAVQPRWPLRAAKRVSRRQLFAVIEAALDREQPVLIALSGVHSHYTVVCGYSRERLHLFDSNGRHWLARSGIGPRKGGTRWRHRVAARSLAVLELG